MNNNSYEVYKITKLSPKYISEGMISLSITLDNSIKIREFEIDLERKYRSRARGPNNTVKELFQRKIKEGKLKNNIYIYAKLGFGKHFCWIEYIRDFDMIPKFISELEKNKEAEFSTDLPIYQLLLKAGREVLDDNSIRLRGQWSDRKVIKYGFNTYCLIDNEDLTRLNHKNIKIIFEKFYKFKQIPQCTDPDDKPIQYIFREFEGIFLERNVNRVHSNYHKSRSRNDFCGLQWTAEIKIGELLTEEQKAFLLEYIKK